MRNETWIALIGRFAPDQHDNLILVTSNAIELAIQAILRTEADYIVIRARMSGTDISRTLFVPYATISYIGFLKPVKEAQVRAMYGEPEPVPVEPKAVPESNGAPPAPPPAPEGSVGEQAAETEKPGEGPPAAAPAPPADKRTMLERLRSRSFVGTMKMPPNR